MIIKMRDHKTATNIVVVEAGPELAATMGRFAPARWQAKAKVYWLEVDQIDGFQSFARINGHTIVDERGTVDEPAKFTGPLPECANCGQPARRSAVLAHCPACGAPWAVAARPPAIPADQISRTCSGCERAQAGAFGFCSDCGAPMVAVVNGARPAHVRRPTLGDPVLFADTIVEVAAELDHKRRQAGERDDER